MGRGRVTEGWENRLLVVRRAPGVRKEKGSNPFSEQREEAGPMKNKGIIAKEWRRPRRGNGGPAQCGSKRRRRRKPVHGWTAESTTVLEGPRIWMPAGNYQQLSVLSGHKAQVDAAAPSAWIASEY